jgi:selenium metabolism protein YedF
MQPGVWQIDSVKHRKEEKMAEMNQGGQKKQAYDSPGAEDEQGDNSVMKTLVILATDCVGKGNDELGRSIVLNFVKTMKEMGDELWRLVLLNGGVKLAAEGSEALAPLQELARDGLGILVCGKCLETFDLAEKKRVGAAANMLDIVSSMQVAEKVISFT